MPLEVQSEIGRLRRVLIHRPGLEIDWMVPSMMERLLFDDILDGEEARHEHESFQRVLEAAGVETVDPLDLLREVLADSDVKGRVLERLERDHGVDEELLQQLEWMPPGELAETLITGLRHEDVPYSPRGRGFYRLPPVPNYFFQRDPQAVLGDRVMLSAMATAARQREPLLARTIFESHPSLAGWSGLVELDFEAAGDGSFRASVEGGDVLVPSSELLIVGLSERTSTRGVEALAGYFRRHETSFRHMLVVELPPRRSYMHLDTVFTFIDHGLCLAYLPVIAPGGLEAGHIYRIDLRAKELAYVVCDDLPSALASLGIEIELVPCGGAESLIDQQREQWTDGANAFALAPGVITVYRRNRRTTDELARRGWRVIGEEDVISGVEEVLGHGPTVVTLLGNELARARGGPRCMTMPLEREPLA